MLIKVWVEAGSNWANVAGRSASPSERKNIDLLKLDRDTRPALPLDPLISMQNCRITL
jgi:hypothetical protein